MAPPNNLSENVKLDESVLMDWEPPRAQGLYDPQNEHEACGVGFIVAIDGKRNHKVSSSSSKLTSTDGSLERLSSSTANSLPLS
jgi:hypothetical protein